eukprot:8601647-Pyramimonas_sp.AAC.1
MCIRDSPPRAPAHRERSERDRQRRGDGPCSLAAPPQWAGAGSSTGAAASASAAAAAPPAPDALQTCDPWRGAAAAVPQFSTQELRDIERDFQVLETQEDTATPTGGTATPCAPGARASGTPSTVQDSLLELVQARMDST